QRHQDEYDQRIGREYGHAPILVVAKAHFLVGEELMVVERVALIDRAQALDVHRPVHDVLMHRPLEQIGEEEGDRHGKPLERVSVVVVLMEDEDRGRAHGVDDRDVKIPVVPPHDAGTVLLPKINLARADHGYSPSRRQGAGRSRLTDISHIYHTEEPLFNRPPPRRRRGATLRPQNAPPPPPWRPPPAFP